jgi:CTP synthase
VLGYTRAHSTEFDPTTPYPVIDLMEDQADVEDLGGTMRLGVYPAKLTAGTLTEQLYGDEVIYERHRHRWEVNNRYRTDLEEAGLVFAGKSPDDRLVEIVELPGHPFFIASQFHPEFKSRPDNPHPLFNGFMAAALDRRRSVDNPGAVDAETSVSTNR